MRFSFNCAQMPLHAQRAPTTTAVTVFTRHSILSKLGSTSDEKHQGRERKNRLCSLWPCSHKAKKRTTRPSIFQLLATNILTQCRESKETAHTCGNLYALQLAACQLPSAGSPSAHRRELSSDISSGLCWPSQHKIQSSGNKLWHHHAACCTAGLFWTIQAVWWQHATSCETS